jgi:hypothetical protein
VIVIRNYMKIKEPAEGKKIKLKLDWPIYMVLTFNKHQMQWIYSRDSMTRISFVKTECTIVQVCMKEQLIIQ